MHEGEREKELCAEEETREWTEPNTSQKRKQPPKGKDEPRRTRGVQVDYWQLADPYPLDDKSNEENLEDEEENKIILIAEAEDEFQSLKEAKELPDWPKWKLAIQTELNQHQEKGTWELVDLPVGVTPLKNKWVFILKKDKEGCIIKYKAWLVIKGFGQHPRQDYLEMHFPVVYIKLICTIIAIATAKHLLMQ